LKSLHKNALALFCINRVLNEFKENPTDYIKNYDSKMVKQLSDEIESWKSSENFLRDLKLLSNEYYRRIKK